MSVAIIKSKKVEKHNDVFILHVGFKHYDLGVQIHSWGVRFKMNEEINIKVFVMVIL
jgi:hypothetical protein